jgi:hypothetical protein
MSRRALVVSALFVQVLVVLAVLADAPFAVRLPLSLVYVFAVPGFAAVGLLRLPEPVTELALSVVLSMALTIATAQLLVWSGTYSLGAALAVLGAVTGVGLVAQLFALSADDEEADEDADADEPAEPPPASRPRRPRPQAPSWAHPHIGPRNDWR